MVTLTRQVSIQDRCRARTYCDYGFPLFMEVGCIRMSTRRTNCVTLAQGTG